MAQIERAVEMVTQQVANSRGMNLVLHRRRSSALTNEFDMTPAVVDDLNKVLAAVVIPPDGVSPVAMQQKEGATPAMRRPHRRRSLPRAAGRRTPKPRPAAAAPVTGADGWPPLPGDPRFSAERSAQPRRGGAQRRGPRRRRSG